MKKACGSFRNWWRKLFSVRLEAALRGYAPLCHFSNLVFRSRLEEGSLPADLPASVKTLIEDHRSALQFGEVFCPLGLAIGMGGQISAKVSNAYGDSCIVNLRCKLSIESLRL